MDPNPMNENDASGAAGATLPPPLPPPTAPRVPWWQVRVARDPDDRKLGGVISGISRSYGFDVRTTRIAVAIAALVLPVIFALYIAAWVLLPEGAPNARPLRDVATDRRRLPLVIALAIVITITSIGSFGSWFVFGGLGWGLALIALGVVLWAAPNLTKSNRLAPPATPAPDVTNGPDRSPTAPFAAPTPNVVDTRGVVSRAPAADAWGVPPTVATTPRRRSIPIGAISFVVAVTVSLVAALGDALGWWNTDVFWATIAMLGILIVGQLASAIVNRTWLNIPFALFLMVPTTFLLITMPNLDGGVGERTINPQTVADVDGHSHSLAVGEVTLDLTDVTIGERTVSTSVEVGIGEISVIVPNNVELRLDTRLGAGVVELDGNEISTGVRHDDQRTIEPTQSSTAASEGSGSGTLVLDLEVGAGKISIERVNV